MHVQAGTRINPSPHPGPTLILPRLASPAARTQGCAKVFGNVVAVFLVDRVGRKKLQIAGVPWPGLGLEWHGGSMHEH